MKNNHWSRVKASSGIVLLLAALTGCTAYVETPRPPVVYVQPAAVYVAPPPPVYVAPSPAPDAVVEIRVESDFYAPLSPYGRWIQVDGYGRCWAPTGVAQDWRPYTDGHWERTDAGWYWVSSEHWGWATCHYGRWHLDVNAGWVWLPQTQWAPAWVAWRVGGGYTGWAPLPPEARIGVSGSLAFRAEAIEPRSFVFVEQRRMLEPQRPSTVIINNTTIINQTVNITQIKVVNHTVINEGPPPATIAKAVGHSVPVVTAHALRTQQEGIAIAAQRNTPSATKGKVQPMAVKKPETAQKKSPTARTDETLPAKTKVSEPNTVKSNEKTVPNETKKPATIAEARPTVKPAMSPKQSGQSEKPGVESQTKAEPKQTENGSTAKKPAQPTLTAKQKLAPEQKQKVDEKRRLEEEKSHPQPPSEPAKPQP